MLERQRAPLGGQGIVKRASMIYLREGYSRCTRIVTSKLYDFTHFTLKALSRLMDDFS